MPTSEFDLQAAHAFFSADCFNRGWELMDKPHRSADEDFEMLMLGIVSLWHWSRREDATPANLSVSCWQLSRMHALLGQAEPARVWAERALRHSQAEGVRPFYLAYAYEALARAEMVAGNKEQMQAYLDQAHDWAARVEDGEELQLLMNDLNSFK